MNSKPKQAPVEISPESKLILLKLIDDAVEPLKATTLIKAAGLPKKVTSKVVQELLREEIDSGRIFNWGTAATHLYWNRSVTSEVRERLLAFAAKDVLDDASLVTLSTPGPPKLAKTVVAKALKELVGEGRLRLITPPGTKKKLVVDSDHPEPYLVSEITRLLQTFGREQLAGPMTALLSQKPSQTALPPTASVQEIAAMMFEAINRIADRPGNSVTFYRLRQQPELAHVPKPIFDQAALSLEQERKALLNLHDHAPALPQEARDQFVTDGFGTYYVSIFTR